MGRTTLITTLMAVVSAFSSPARAQAPPPKDVPAIAKAANGAIVSIVMSDKDGHAIAQGSGFLISNDGVILTNYHVIAEGNSAAVKFPDGAFYVVDGVLASDKARDIAVIKVHGQNFRTLLLGNSDRVQVGEDVVAIGNPLSLESTVSNGIVSGIRTVEEEGGKFLQVTTPISPGSSGGPLFNMAGEVIGITTMYLKGGENLNFAIPINDAKPLLSAESSKIQPLPNETELVKEQTPNAAEALRWIQANMTKEICTSSSDTRCEITTNIAVQGCQATIYEETRIFIADSLTQITDTWGPFAVSALQPDEMGKPKHAIGTLFPNDNVLVIFSLNPIPLVHSATIQSALPPIPPSTIRTVTNQLQIQFDSNTMLTRQEKAWHDAIIGCGGKPTSDAY
jgi:V8-like Glu-specific endopeptidase